MKPVFYFFNPEITIASIETQTTISVVPKAHDDIRIQVGKAVGQASFRPEGDLHYIWFATWNCAKVLMEELNRNFILKFVSEEDLVDWSQADQDLESYIQASIRKYFHVV